MAENLYRALTDEEFADIQARILYEDNHIIIFNKRVGEITQSDKTGDESLGDVLKAFIAKRDSKPGAVYIGIPHRLDRPVSGLAIFAKTSKAHERLCALLREGEIHKTYWALVCKEPPVKMGESVLLEDYMVRNEKQNKSYIVSAPSKNNAPAGRKSGRPLPAAAKLARLRYTYVDRTERYFLVSVELLTGRHHQIRCQLSHIGCVIKGDLKYGAPRSDPDGGICLLARRISFIHPVKKTQIDITAPVPLSWKGVSYEAI